MECMCVSTHGKFFYLSIDLLLHLMFYRSINQITNYLSNTILFWGDFNRFPSPSRLLQTYYCNLTNQFVARYNLGHFKEERKTELGAVTSVKVYSWYVTRWE